MINSFLLVFVAVLVSGDDNVINVPKDVMRFILGCQQQGVGSDFAVPVYQTKIDDTVGTTSQHVSLLDLEELGHSLRKTVQSDEVLGQILGQVKDAVESSVNGQGRSECSIENHIQIEIPPQELDGFNDKLQLLTKQNDLLLLEQINNLFNYKLRSQRIELEKLLKRRTNNIFSKLNRILALLGDTVTDGDDNEATESGLDDGVTETPEGCKPVGATTQDTLCKEIPKPATEVEAETVSEPKPEPVSEPKPEPASEPKPEPVSEPEPEPEPEPKPVSVSDVEPETKPKPESVSEPEPEPAPVNETESKPETPLEPAPVTDVPAASNTTFFPVPSDGASSSEEIGDDSANDRIANPSPKEPAANAGFERVAQKPTELHESVGLLRPMLGRKPTIQEPQRVRLRLSYPLWRSP